MKQKEKKNPLESSEDSEATPQEVNEQDSVKNYSRLKKRPFKQRMLDKYFPDKTYLINMEMSNGMFRSFVVSVKKDSFVFQKRRYVIDSQLKYFSIDDRLWCLDYHQELAIPINRRVPIAKVKRAIEASGVTQIESATNPQTLEEFMLKEVVKQVMTGQDLDAKLRTIKLVAIITMIVSIGMLLLFMQKSGMLSRIGGVI